jgi:carbon storage regulator CsrA
MLVLSRKKQESVVVGGPELSQRILRVTVLEICGEKVKLGFDADPDVPVHRLEVWERIFGNRQADQSSHGSAAPVAHDEPAGSFQLSEPFDPEPTT